MIKTLTLRTQSRKMDNSDRIKKFNVELEEFCELDIFKNTDFLDIVHVYWNSEVLINGKTPEDNFCLGEFGCFPGGINSSHKFPPYEYPLKLNTRETEDRLKAKIKIRKIFARNDEINLFEMMDILFHFDLSSGGIRDNIFNTLMKSPIRFGEPYQDLDDDITIKLKLHKYEKRVTKESLDINPLSYIDIFILYLYSDLIHSDEDKKYFTNF